MNLTYAKADIELVTKMVSTAAVAIDRAKMAARREFRETPDGRLSRDHVPAWTELCVEAADVIMAAEQLLSDLWSVRPKEKK